MRNIKEIRFPNTVAEENQTYYRVGLGCDEIRLNCKNGEMADVGWFDIIKDNKIIAEIKESVCNIFGEDNIPDKTNIPF